MRAKAVLYSITKQIRQYEPIRIEVTVEAQDGEDDAIALIEHARDLAEQAMGDALYRASARGGVAATALPLQR